MPAASPTTLPDPAALTLDEKLGQMLCVGWEGPDSYLNLNAQARHAVREMKVGSMVVMGRNVNAPTAKGEEPTPIDAAGVRAMLEEMQSLADVPLLIGTDQEGGRVARFGTTPFTRMPSAKVIGDAGDTDLARAAARATARELRAVGINWDYAPVADVNSNPANPVIGDRSFGATPETVTPLVVAQVEGYAEGGVLACVKHFPGHGDTSQDSHYDLPTVPFPLDDMERRELAPFRAAIAAGVPTIMTAHILFPAVDPDLPATLSPRILTGLLRETLGFDGLLVTDSLGMKAVSDRWGSARAAVLAAVAGADMVMMCHVPAEQQAILAAMKEAVGTGELPEARVDEAVRRIFDAKRRALEMPTPGLDVIGCAEHVAIREALAGAGRVESGVSTLGE